MPIETANYISQLDPTNPAAPDLLADTDNHLRMIKQVLKNTFPNINAAVDTTPHQMGSYVPIGTIAMWHSSVGTIPTGWGLCNGQTLTRTDGGGSIITPNLTDRFIKGINLDGTDGGTMGGSVALAGTTSTSGSHSHTGSTDSQGLHNHGFYTSSHALTHDQMPFHTHDTVVAVLGAAGNGLVASSAVGVAMETRTSAGAGSNNPHYHTIGSDGYHAHSVSTSTTGSHTHTVAITDGRPPFYSLAFIMKY